MSESDKPRGLYKKYKVERVDKSEKHVDCEYFVLDLDCDKFALNALYSYMCQCEAEYPYLAKDLRKKLIDRGWYLGEMK